MNKFILNNADIVNEGEIFTGSVVVKGEFIEEIKKGFQDTEDLKIQYPDYIIYNLENKLLLPGIIDDQVHFREPGLTHKGDIYTESKAAVAGGVTSYMDMPNTNPQTLTQEFLEEKYKIASEKSLANFSFYMGASNDNNEEILKTNPENVCGIKIFMGASTGNMLVDDEKILKKIFSNSNMLIAVHCEDEKIIRKNIQEFTKKYNDNIPFSAHSKIRSREACLKSSSYAVSLAKRFNTRLHILHLSTLDEMFLFDNSIPLDEKKITAEVCVHHLWFSDEDYNEKGSLIKWNPSIKTVTDRNALIDAVNKDIIDIIATDHAPHTLEEKQNSYLKSPSGGPMVQHSLTAMIEIYKKGLISFEKIVQKMAHNPAILFKIDRRGFIRKNYFADIVIVDIEKKYTPDKENIFYKCKWSPFENYTFSSSVIFTYVNGNLVYSNGNFNENNVGKRLIFNC